MIRRCSEGASWRIGRCSRILMVFSWYSHGILMVFSWYSHGILMVFSWCSSAPNRVRREIDRRRRGAAIVTIMRFLRRHQYLLCFLGVLAFSCVMVLHQLMANQSAHIELRDDFLLLH